MLHAPTQRLASFLFVPGNPYFLWSLVQQAKCSYSTDICVQPSQKKRCDPQYMLPLERKTCEHGGQECHLQECHPQSAISSKNLYRNSKMTPVSITASMDSKMTTNWMRLLLSIWLKLCGLWELQSQTWEHHKLRCEPPKESQIRMWKNQPDVWAKPQS